MKIFDCCNSNKAYNSHRYTSTKAMRSALSIWLGVCCMLILFMVLIGGITRLTNSGLSITEWRPITGVIPPLNNEDWIREKSKYERTPEYLHINRGISLGDFKLIYMTEYVHRLLGRVLGIVFFVPLVYFTVYRRINRRITMILAGAACLGLFQGVMGWMMVKSGLIDVPFVSHFRLSAHLCITVVLFSLIWYCLLESIGKASVRDVTPSIHAFLIFTVAITGIQIMLGAFVAGLDAGFVFNTFPLMDGAIIPRQILSGELLNSSFLYDNMVVQFMHRTVAMLVLISAIALTIMIRRRSTLLLSFCVVVQFLLGVATLVLGVPIHLASMHQIMSFVVVAVEVYIVRTTRRKRLY